MFVIMLACDLKAPVVARHIADLAVERVVTPTELTTHPIKMIKVVMSQLAAHELVPTTLG